MDVRVSKGDSIWKIAKARKPEGVSTAEFVQQILDANDLEDPDKLQIGQIIKVPGEDVPTPRPRPNNFEMTGEAGGGAEATVEYPGGGQLSVRQASPDEIVALVQNGEARRQKAQLENLSRDLSIQFGKGKSTKRPGFGENRGPVPAQGFKDDRSGLNKTLTEVLPEQNALKDLGWIGPNQNKDESRLPQEDVLDLDVLGLTPFRPPPPSRNIFNEYAAQLPPPRPQYVSQAAKLPSALDRGAFTVGDPGGLVEEGNIDLSGVRVTNPDGSISDARAASFTDDDGSEVLLPLTNAAGEEISGSEAVDAFRSEGRHLGKFESSDAAIAYAKRLGEAQNPNIPRDPDHFIDLGSERWRDVFVRAPAEAAAANRQRSRDQQRAADDAAATRKAQSTVKPAPKTRDTPQLDWIGKVISGAAGPSFQPTKVPNASK